MSSKHPIKSVVTVTEMTRMVGLSRARFYQLIKEGIFPKPCRKTTTNRPFYDQDQQEQCLTVRRTNQGINGRAILFYGQQVDLSDRVSIKPKPPKRRPARERRRGSAETHPDPLIDELKHGLGQLGVTAMNDASIRKALADEYPDGHNGVDPAVLLMTVFRCLKRQNSTDNLAR